jgi:DNA-3-methyladenine glycosylase I
LKDDNLLFERLILEINQAGLSWITILKKADGFRRAYHGFDIAKVARYGEKDRARLLADPGIIRNRLKVNAAIVNAQKILELQKECGSFAAGSMPTIPARRMNGQSFSKRRLSLQAGRSSTSS